MSAWQFSISTPEGEPAGEITVHQGTGRWGQKINMETGQISDMGVYLYDATLTDADGKEHNIVIQRGDVLRLRRKAAKQAVQS